MARAPAGKSTRPSSTRAASTAAAAALQDLAASSQPKPKPKPPKSPKKKTVAKPLAQDEQDWAREMLRKKMAAFTGGAAAPAPAPAPAAAPKPLKADASTSMEKAGKKPKDEGKEEEKEGKKEKSKKKKLVAPRTVDVDAELSDDDEPPKKKAKSKGKEKEKAVAPETPAAKPSKKAPSSVAVVIPAKSTTKAPPATPARDPVPAHISSPAIEIESKKARRKQKKAEKAEKAAPAPEPAQPEPAASQAASEVDPAEKERKRKERKEKKKAKKAEEKKSKEAEESQQAEQAEPPVKKKDKGKGKAVAAPPPASPVKKAATPAASAASKKRKRAESPAPSEAGPSRAAPAANRAKTQNATSDRKHKKRKVDAAAAVATQTTTEVILHATSPAALAAAKTASPLGPILPMALAPFMMPHAYDEQQNKALVEQIVQNFVNAGYGEQVDKAMRGVKRTHTGEERQARVAPITDANAVAGPSGTSTSARTPAQPAAKDTPPSAPVSSPIRTVKPPPSSAPQPTPKQQRVETPASTRSSSPAPSTLGLSLNGNSNGSDGSKKRRVRPSKAARKVMSQASQSQPNTDVEEGSSVRQAAAVKAAVEAVKRAEPIIASAAEDTQVVPETMDVESREPSTQPDEEDQLDATPRPAAQKEEDVMDIDVQEVEPTPVQKQAHAEPKQVEAEEQVESDEELDELDSTPAQSVTHQQQQRSNPAVSRVVESDSRAVTPSTSEDDDEEVQLSLKAHASPASAKKKAEDLPVEPEEAPLPPAAQTPSRNAQEEKEDEQKLSHAANTRLPSSSPEPALPTIGGKRNDKDSDESSSSSSEEESDESSDDEAGGSSSLLTRNAAHLRNGGGGRPSLSLLAKEAFSKPKKRGSLLGGANGINKVLASSTLGYAGSPLKHSPLNAASSSPARTDANGEAQEDEEEIDQLLSQTQPSQRPKRTSDAYWAQLEREEEEKKKRKGKGKQDETSDDDVEDRMEVDADTAPIASTGQTPADVAEPAEADAAETAAAVNGAPATGEPVFANASGRAPRPSANTAGAPPITTAVEPDAALSPPRRRISPDPQPLPNVTAVASTSFLSPTQASQRPPDRIYPDLSSIGNLPTSSQAGSPPIEVDDPSQVFSGEDRPVVGDEDDDDEEEEDAQQAPAESQFVPLQKDKPLFLETQTQSFSQETAGADGVQELAADADPADALEAEAPADDEEEEEEDAPAVKVNGSARAPPTPDASKETSPAPPAIVEPDQVEDEQSAAEGVEDEEDDGPTPKATSFAKENHGLAVPTTPARITRASSARLASRSPSAEPPHAASQPVNGTPVSPRRTYADRRKPEAVTLAAPNSARMPRAAVSASQPTASTPSAFASGSRASRMLSLSQLDTVKQPTRRSTRASLAASASQPTTSQRSFIARDSDDEDDEDDDAASSDEEAGAGKGKGQVRKTRASMSQPVPGTQANGRSRRSRQSDLWR